MQQRKRLCWLWIWTRFIELHCGLCVKNWPRWKFPSNHIHILSKHHTNPSTLWPGWLVFTDGNCSHQSAQIKWNSFFLFSEVAKHTHIFRECGYRLQKSNSCVERRGFGGIHIVCSCNDKDNCNKKTIVDDSVSA